MKAFIQTLSESIVNTLKSTKGTQSDQQSLIASLIEEQLKKVGFIGREEFDAQTKILERTRNKLTELESTVRELENSKS